MPGARKPTDIPIPEDHEEESEEWKKAFRHAMSMQYTSEKGAILYADAHQFDSDAPTAA